MTLIRTEIRNLDGTLRLDMKPSTGYRRVTLTTPGGQAWSVPTEESAYVDSETLGGTPARRPALARNEVIHVYGTRSLLSNPATVGQYWRQVEDRIEALATAAATPFLWAICDGGYLWTYRAIGPATVDPSIADREDLDAGRRPVLLRFRVNPSPTKTNPEA